MSSEETHESASESHDGGSPSERSEEASETPRRSDGAASVGESHFDHRMAWETAFKKFDDLPEAILNALKEVASSRKKDEKEPEEEAVQQEEAVEENKNNAPATPGKKGKNSGNSGNNVRKPFGHKFMGW